MLLQFAVENYLSFRERAVLSMLADPRGEHGPGQVLEGPGGRKVLRIAALYGANGAGKSNLVKALGAVRDMVLKGTRGDERLPIVPFKLDPARREAPAHFELELVAEGKHCSYGFEATASRVESEWLYEIVPGGEERLLFEREAGEQAPLISVGDALSTDPKRRAFMEFVALGTRQNQLFLAETGERNVVELEPVRRIIRDWRLFEPDAPYPPLLHELENDNDFRTLMGLVLKEAGTGIDELRVVFQEVPPDSAWHFEGDRYEHLMSLRRLDDGQEVALDIAEESDGTRRLLNLAPILHHMKSELLFLVDEMERSLHPLLTRMLLQLFFARAGAGPGAAAQLIFTTHDTNLLDRGVLSRDSIWLMEKDPRGGSVMYPLSELDQAQVDEVERQGKGLERGYLQGRFGAIPFFGSLEALGFRKDQLL